MGIHHAYTRESTRVIGLCKEKTLQDVLFKIKAQYMVSCLGLGTSKLTCLYVATHEQLSGWMILLYITICFEYSFLKGIKKIPKKIVLRTSLSQSCSSYKVNIMLKTRKDKRLCATPKEFEERERAFLSQIIQGSTIPTLVVNSDHICTHWNKAMENLTGHPAEEVVGTNRQWIAFYPKSRPTMADLIVDDLQEEILKLYKHKCRKS